jgi:CRISPR type II-A-associated protein Csn2
MKVMYKFFSKPLDFENCKMKLVVIENKELLRNTLINLYNDNDEEYFVFSENFEPVKFSKKVVFSDNVLTFEVGDKKLMTKVTGEMEKIGNSKYYTEICSLREALFSLGSRLSEEMDFDFDFNEDVETADILKMLSFTPRNDFSNQTEKILRFMRLMNVYMGIKCFVFCNLHIFLTDEEIEMLYQSAVSNEIYILDIEGSVPTALSSYEEKVIIDKDLCEIVDN